MDSRPLEVDISSDDGGDNYDWISELLDEAERKGDDSDDVLLMSEGVVKPKHMSKPKVKDLDDDCVVLDGDPDKPVVIENDAAGDSVDLLVVGEKGQVACRDYPHSRHLCANFPFTSTPHERHCHQCHCYVCDLLAPCVDWGNGTSCIDHCHANDKDEFWIYARRYIKKGDKAPLSVHKLPDTSLLAQPQQNQWPSLTQLQPNSVPHNQISTPTTIPACTTSTNFGIPNITYHGGSKQYAHILSRNKFQPHLVSQHLLNAQNDVIRRDQRHNSGNFGSHVINYRKVFKRAGSRVALASNLSGYGSFCSDLVSQYCRNASGVAASNDKIPPGCQSFPNRTTSNPIAYHVPSHPNMGSVFVNSVPSRTQVYSQPIPALNDRQVGFQQANRDFSALVPWFSDVDTSRLPPTCQSNQQSMADNSQVQSAEFDPQILVNTNPGSLDFQFDSSMLENWSVFGALEVSEPSGLNLYSSEPAPVDAGFFFDF